MSTASLQTLATSNWISVSIDHILGVPTGTPIQTCRVQFFVCCCNISKELFLQARVEAKNSQEKAFRYLTKDENMIFFHSLEVSAIPSHRVTLLNTIDQKKTAVYLDFSQKSQSPKVIIRSKE